MMFCDYLTEEERALLRDSEWRIDGNKLVIANEMGDECALSFSEAPDRWTPLAWLHRVETLFDFAVDRWTEATDRMFLVDSLYRLARAMA